MFQYKYNDEFSKIVIDIPHWEKEEDIPDYIIKFIEDTSNKRVFYEDSTGNFYCGKCVNKLDENFYCSVCGIKHKKYNVNDIGLYNNRDITIINKKTTDNSILNNTCSYLVFNVVNQNAFLYDIEEEIFYNTNPIYLKPYKTSKLSIYSNGSYFIEKDGLTNLKTNLYISFDSLINCSKKFNRDYDEYYKKVETSNLYKQCDYILTNQNAFLYTDNLTSLKNTVYRYSRLWEMEDYLKEQDDFCLESLTLYPLYYPQFEYLVNYKLYNLAFYIPDEFKKGKNFKETFGIDKKYLPFMKEHNIDGGSLKILKLFPTTDIETLNFFNEWTEFNYLDDLVLKYKVNLTTLRNYLINLGLSSKHITDYLDYIFMAKELHLNLEDKKVLYPVNLREAHDELFNQIETIKDPIIDKKINDLSSSLSLNKYEDNNYIIYPATSIEDLFEESRQQKNCVRTYCEKIANNECQIYFMRKKEDISKSFVTIEVCNNRIVQARIKYNKLPSREITKILNKWEKTLLPFSVEC